ncbi:hypothetical protein KKA95_02075 [Patescibacteria group bacterium]|nr:hypothetical protein [Patescibacteria group bacterium]
MNIPKGHIPKFLIAIIILIVIVFAITNDKDKDDFQFDFSFDLSEEELVIDGEEESAEEEATPAPTTTTTTTSTTTTPATEVAAPATTTAISSCYPSLSGRKDSKFNAIILSWTECEDNDDFQFYKLVKSQTNPNPIYPNDTVIMSSSNPGTANYVDKTVARALTYHYRVCVVQRLGKVTCSNAISVTY